MIQSRKISAILALALLIVGCSRIRSLPDIPGEAMRRSPPEGIAARAVAVGAGAPDFRLPAHTGGHWSLKENLAEGPVVLIFYRGYW